MKSVGAFYACFNGRMCSASRLIAIKSLFITGFLRVCKMMGKDESPQYGTDGKWRLLCKFWGHGFLMLAAFAQFCTCLK